MAINIRATLDRGEADIQVVNETHGGLRYFKPLSDSAREWMQDNLSDESAFLNGELVVESRYADDLMEFLADDGMLFFVPQWMENPPAMCDGCHEPIEGAALDLPIVTCGLVSWCVSQVCDSCRRECTECGARGCTSCISRRECCEAA